MLIWLKTCDGWPKKQCDKRHGLSRTRIRCWIWANGNAITANEPETQLQVLCTCYPQFLPWFYATEISIFPHELFARCFSFIIFRFCGKHLGQWYSNCDHTLEAACTHLSLRISASSNSSCNKYLLTWFSYDDDDRGSRLTAIECSAVRPLQSTFPTFFHEKEFPKCFRRTVWVQQRTQSIRSCLVHVEHSCAHMPSVASDSRNFECTHLLALLFYEKENNEKLTSGCFFFFVQKIVYRFIFVGCWVCAVALSKNLLSIRLFAYRKLLSVDFEVPLLNKLSHGIGVNDCLTIVDFACVEVFFCMRSCKTIEIR